MSDTNIIEKWQQTLEFISWKETVIKKLLSEISQTNQGGSRKTRPNVKDIVDINVENYFIDLINFPNKYRALYNDLELNIYENLKSFIGLLELTDVMRSNSLDIEIKDVTMYNKKVHNSTIVTIDRLKFVLPNGIFKRLKEEGNESIKLLFGLYAPLNITGKNFYTIPKILLDSIESNKEASSPSEIIECFASPLDRYFDRYCSMFEDDQIFGSLGDGFEYLSNAGYSDEFNNFNEEGEFKHRYWIHPPSTKRIIRKLEKVLTDLVFRQSDVEFIIIARDIDITSWVIDGMIIEYIDAFPFIDSAGKLIYEKASVGFRLIKNGESLFEEFVELALSIVK